MIRPLAAALCAVALAGCGDDGVSKDDYEQELTAVAATLQQAFGNVGTAITERGNIREAARRLRRGAAALEQRSQRLGDVEPPSDVEEAHDQLVEGLAELAGEFRRVAAVAGGEGGFEALLAATTELQRSNAFRKLMEASETLAAEEYEFER